MKDGATRSQLRVYGSGKRNELERDKDIWYAVQRIAAGATYQDVADDLNTKNPNYSLTSEMVRQDVQKALVEWKRDNMENIDAYIAKELLRLDKIEKMVEENFEISRKSLRPVEYAALMKRGMTPSEVDEMYEDRPLPGNPQYLIVLLHLQRQRMRLLGLDKGNDVAQQTIVNYQFNGIGDDALAKMADLLQDTKFKEIDDQRNESNL